MESTKEIRTINKLDKKSKMVAIWLLVGVFMIIIQIALGGLTRLTGSGLSMTEWEPIMGLLPPLSHDEWMKAFEAYQQIAQYKYVNSHFTLKEFKFIFYWEWFHRNWARFLAVVFLVPFFYFLYKKYFTKEMITPLVLLFVFGALQGFIGWYMVQSGLDDSSLFYVSHIRLSVHLITALGLLVYTLWFALKILIPRENIIRHTKLRNYYLIVIILFTIQLFYGAFMAGLHAARIAPSWPKMNGHWFPPKLMECNWIYDDVGVQFVHRGIAYILYIMIIIGFFKVYKIAKDHNSKLLKRANYWSLILVNAQVILGIYTLLAVSSIVKDKFGLYETLAQLHQIVAMLLLVSLMFKIYLIRGEKK